ncbi:MAG: hypothetical protein HY985_04285 [Magnetospirillum sp.]|nr:hypothetical protein [Magnetospirillum sp.]
MTRRTWLPALTATALAAWAVAASAASPTGDKAAPAPPSMGVLREILLRAPSDTAMGTVAVTVMQINYPGVPERAACRMQIVIANEGKSQINLRTLLVTLDDSKTLIDNWLVPSGTIAPGKSVERLYSCKIASTLTVDRDSAYGWPRQCDVNGVEMSPCPLALRVSSSLPMPP